MYLKKYYNEFETHLLEDEKPSLYFNQLVKSHQYPKGTPFNQLLDLKKIEQSLIHHPEGNVWNHTMLVLDYAAIVKDYSQDVKAFMWATLLHDIGKSTTTKLRKGRITAYNHDTEGAILAEKFLKKLTSDNNLINNVKSIVRWHMQPLFVSKKLPYAKAGEMIKEINPAEIGLFSICDRLGRGKMSSNKIEEQMKSVTIFLHECKKHMKEDDLLRIEKVEAIIKDFYVKV
ncbi:MAG: HDIG domain-containing metalloprotein [Eubacteriales bacterium]